MPDYRVTPLDEGIDFENLPFWDVVIIGAGPAGLAASLTTAHRGLTTLVIEAKAKPGGQPEFLYGNKRIVDVPGFPDGISGEELSERVVRQARNAMVQFRFQEELVDIEETDEIERGDPLHAVVTDRCRYRCRKVILACGLLHYPRRLPVLDALGSKNVYYKIPQIGDYSDQDVAVVGGGDSALDAALMVLRRHGGIHVIVRHEVSGRADALRQILEAGGVLHTSTEIASAAFHGDGIKLTLTTGRQLDVDVVVVQIGFLSARDTFQRLGVRLNDDGSVAVDPYFETSRSGVFAAGDVHGNIKLIPVAWAEGIQAAIYAFDEITRPYWLNEQRLRAPTIALMGEKLSRAARQLQGDARYLPERPPEDNI